MTAIFALERDDDLLRQSGIREQVAVEIGVLLSKVRPIIEVRELNTKDSSLESVEPRIQSDPFVIVTLLRAMDSKSENLSGQFVIIRRHETAVAHAAKIL